MTIEELIENFENQKLQVKQEIEQLKDTLKDREEYLVKLNGGIEALNLYKDYQGASELPDCEES